MPIPGISLVGFLDQSPAESYLSNICVPSDPAQPAVHADWQAAKGKLGPAIPNAGNPNILPIPQTHATYIAQLYALQWAQLVFPLTLVNFALVEIDPLLAYQFHISDGHSAKHGAGFGNPPTIDELMAVCLQTNRPAEGWTKSYGPQSMLITSRDLNVRAFAKGPLNDNLAGMAFGIGLPWVHVVRFNGRCYLHNGFHRALAARKAGATHIPCAFRDVLSAQEVGIQADGTFSQQLLESNDPPTLGHYTNGRAHAVQLRQFTRALHVTWAEYSVPEE
jgi:hypothetical protein